jgi:hypothetical protein
MRKWTPMPRWKRAARQTWMADFEANVVAALPTLAGRIDWDTATFLFDQGLDPQTAAAQVIARAGEEV